MSNVEKLVEATTVGERPAGGEAYLAHKHGITTEEEVREIVAKVGPCRSKIEAAAAKLKEGEGEGEGEGEATD